MLTKLEAVNEMLEAIGEEPVSSLASGLAEAEEAANVLERTSRKVQASGWTSNTEELQWTRNSDGEVELPTTVLRITPIKSDKIFSVTPRKDGSVRKLWNTKDRTFVFPRDPWVQVIYFRPFEEVSFPLQNYITVVAVKKYQRGDMSSKVLDVMNSEDVVEAYAQLLDAESELDSLNMIYSNPHGRRVAHRDQIGIGLYG
jgi:hypothetical protein